MLLRSCGQAGAAILLLAACGGSSQETSRGGGGTGGSAESGDSGGSSGLGAAGKGGSSGEAGSSGKGGMPAGGKGGDAGTATGGVAIDDAPSTVAVELCDKIYECCSADELMNIQGIGTTKSQCQLAVAVVITLEVNAVKPAIAAGRVAYDGSALSRCLDDYGSRSCDLLRGIETFECEGLIVPQQAVGDDCGVTPECIDGYCAGSSNASNPVGKCAPTRENGADCASNAECQSAFCNTEGKCADPDASALCGG
ncbi:MAG TPA: hypothetical protein VGQ57_08470 [Polyangiaceae bacterium]|jgi:hypothetical protein|nr:hypothetical protein [Polyangiaceae bacterium]